MTDESIRKALKRWPDALAMMCAIPVNPVGKERAAITLSALTLLDALQESLRPQGVPECFEPDPKAPQAAPPTINGYAVGVWHKWGGGRCPFDNLATVTVSMQMRFGTPCTRKPANFQWRHGGRDDDIIAFYIVPPCPFDGEAKP